MTITLTESQWGKMLIATKLHQDECVDGELWTSPEMKDAHVALHRALYNAREQNQTDTTSESEGIPLKNAMIAWTSAKRMRGPERIAVVRHPEDGASTRWATSTLGACCSPWDKATTEQRLLLLFKIMSILINAHGFSYSDVHAAFLAIPEYARATNRRESFEFERQQ